MLDFTSRPPETGQGLTVADLIDLLETFDPDTPVLVRGENGGLDEVLGLRLLPVRLHVNSCEGFGPHELASAGETADGLAVLVRTSGR